jgi:hypothetical protein
VSRRSGFNVETLATIALVDCDSDFEEFVETMDILGPKLGPMVFQFPLFDRWKYPLDALRVRRPPVHNNPVNGRMGGAFVTH